MAYEALLAEYRRLARSDRGAARRVARTFSTRARREGDALREAQGQTLLAELDLAGGRLRRAAEGFDEAARGLRACGASAVPALLGVAQARALLGDAARARRSIATLRRARLDPLRRAYSEISIGNALGALGDEHGAEDALRRALAALGRRRKPDAVAIARATAQLNLGVRLARRGAIDDALRHLACAASGFDERAMSAPAAVARHNRGWALGVGGEAEPALAELDAARALFEEQGDRRRAALVALDVAELRARFGDHARAAEEARAAARALAAVEAPLEQARALLVAARSREESGGSGRRDAQRALARFEQAGDVAGVALAKVQLGEDLARAERTLQARGHWIGAIEALLARVRADDPARGARLLARRWSAYPRALRGWLEPERRILAARAAEGAARVQGLRRAVGAIEALRERAPTGALRAAVILERLDVYGELARALLERGRAADRREAFLVLDAARARTLREEIAREAPGLVEPARVRTERQRLDRLWSALEAREREPGDLRAVTVPLLSAIARAEREWIERVESLRGAPRVRPRDRRLAGAPCLAFDVIGGDVYGLFSHRGRVDVWRCGRLETLRAELDAFGFQVARRLHGASDAEVALAGLRRLGTQLFSSAPGLPAEGPLCVVVPPALGDLPVGALPVEGVALLERCEVYQAPTAASHEPVPRPGGALLVGIEDHALPDVRQEIRWLARRLPGATRLEGQNAGRAEVLAGLGRHGIVHLAGHAETRADLPPLSSLPLRDGRLTASDLAGARLGGTLVVLSACRTGDPSLRWRGEAMAGFPRALMAAGADAVVASRWEVPDKVAFAWTRALYPRLTRTSAARAVAEAARTLKREYRHPADWAAFLLIRPGTIEEIRF